MTVERDGQVLLIGVNRPAKRNAFNLAAIDALGRAYEILGTDDELRVGVLFAHGDHFSAGLDLAEVVPAGAHVRRATELARLVARQAPLGVQATLASARAGLDHGPDAGRDTIAALLPGIMRSQDAAEGLRSFLERRDAHFTGH
jgi:enoyl-CoA hydratase/carnithine racemase